MNRTKIPWADYSWNPNGQGCPHKCWYCYAMRGARRNYFMHLALYEKGKRKNPPCKLCRDFIPHFHPERLKQPWEVKKPGRVFVDSTADLFADENKLEWKEKIFESMIFCPVKHTFMMLTKRPENISKMVEFPKNWWFGTTVTGGTNWNQNIGMSDQYNIDEIKKVRAKIRFVSFEPLLGPIDFCNHCLEGIQWVIVGKLTGSKKVKLQWDWVANIIQECKKHDIPLFMKNNLVKAFPTLKDNLIQEFPEV